MTNGKTKNLLIVAHPDDETIFFSGALLSEPHSFTVICATDGNADGRGKERNQEFQSACNKLSAAHYEMWDFPDIYEKRLNSSKLIKKLKELGDFDQVFTHNPIGEYGHPHHQDVCHAVYQVFPEEKIFIPAYNVYPEKFIQLSQDEFKLKSKILTDIYGKETNRFLNIIPVTSVEGYLQIEKSEVDSIYDFLSGKSSTLILKAFREVEDLIRLKLKNMKRLF